jgi:presenilin-like A22 family membrane protease
MLHRIVELLYYITHIKVDQNYGLWIFLRFIYMVLLYKYISWFEAMGYLKNKHDGNDWYAIQFGGIFLIDAGWS